MRDWDISWKLLELRLTSAWYGRREARHSLKQILDIFWRCIVHSPDAPQYILDCPRLVEYIRDTFVFLTVPTEWDEPEQLRFAWCFRTG